DIPRNTVYRIFNGEAKLDNLTLRNAELLNKFYLNNEEEIKMKKAMNQIEEVNYGWVADAIEVLGGIDSLAEDYVDVMDHKELDVTAEQFIVQELEKDNRIKEDTVYDNEAEAYEDGFIWVDEIDKWVQLDK